MQNKQNEFYLKSHVVYEFSCPACNAGYIAKTNRNLGTWIKNIVDWIKNHKYLIILQSVTFTSTPLPYIVFHVMVMRLIRIYQDKSEQ